MKTLMLTSAVMALLLGRAWTNAQESTTQKLPRLGQTVIQEARGKVIPTTHEGYDEAARSSETRRKHTSVDDGRATAVVGNMVQPTDGFVRDSWGNARPVMGIIVQPVPAALAAQLPMLGEDRGWLVSEILAESPLGGGDGLKLYDVIVAVDCEPIETIRQFRRVLAMSLGLDPIPVEIIRGGKAKAVELHYFAEPESAPHENARPAAANQSVSISFADRDLSLALASSDGVNYQLEVTYRDANGQSVKQRLAGTSAHILKQTGSLPVPVQQVIRRTLAPTPEAEGTQEPSTPKDAVPPRTQEPARPE